MVYDDLIHRLSDALERGEVDPARLEALLRRRRPARRVDVASLLRAAGAAVSLAAAAIVAGLHRLVGIVRLTGWGLTASLVVFSGFASDAAGLLTSSSVPWC
jgi:hypothetical protein